jgi:hypothetical protein
MVSLIKRTIDAFACGPFLDGGYQRDRLGELFNKNAERSEEAWSAAERREPFTNVLLHP